MTGKWAWVSRDNQNRGDKDPVYIWRGKAEPTMWTFQYLPTPTTQYYSDNGYLAWFDYGEFLALTGIELGDFPVKVDFSGVKLSSADDSLAPIVWKTREEIKEMMSSTYDTSIDPSNT